MTSSTAAELRNLIGQMSDGSLSAEGAARLNELLESDPVSQDQLLDHLYIDGLLEFEFRGSPPLSKQITSAIDTGSRKSASRYERLKGWNWIVVPSVAFVLSAVLTLMLVNRKHADVDRPVAMNRNGVDVSLVKKVSLAANSAWYGDVADVVENFSGVTPIEGRNMVRFVRSAVDPDHACELYQIVPLQELTSVVSDQRFTIEASASFNAVNQPLNEATFVFGISLFAFSEIPTAEQWIWPADADEPLTFSGSQTRADEDQLSWQQVSTRLQLPENAKFVIVQLVVSRADGNAAEEEFPGQFADDVILRLVADRSE